MAGARTPDGFYDLVGHHLPPAKPVGPGGGRPTKPTRVVMTVIRYVLTVGCRNGDVPAETGRSGKTARRRLRLREGMGVRDRLHADLPGLLMRQGKLDPDTVIVDAVLVRASAAARRPAPAPWAAGTRAARTRSWSIGSGCRRRCGRRGQRQRPHADHPHRAGLPRGQGQAGQAEGDARRAVRRPGLRRRRGQVDPVVAGDRAAPGQAGRAARVRAGEGPPGGGADHLLAQGAQAAPGPLRPPGRHSGRLEHPGSLRHLLPDLA